MVKSPHFLGCNRAGQEHTRGKRDWLEQLDINSERMARSVYSRSILSL
jgi:isopenicillin N synthase-like dioxygenase